MNIELTKDEIGVIIRKRLRILLTIYDDRYVKEGVLVEELLPLLEVLNSITLKSMSITTEDLSE